MKDWKEVPHLFMGGKFKVLIEDSDLEIKLSPGDWNWANNRKPFKLIARPFKSLTEEETAIYHTQLGIDYSHYHEGKFIKSPCLGFIYLLSIGVLPEQFSTEGVIWN